MSDIHLSKTKTVLKDEDIEAIVYRHFRQELRHYDEIETGFYNTIYDICLNDRHVILKVAPAKDVPILTYERDILRKECKILRLLKKLDFPVPEVLAADFSGTWIPSDYLVLEKRPGQNLFIHRDQFLDKAPYRHQTMMYLAQMHRLSMPFFGYENFTQRPTSMKTAYRRMFADLMADALRIGTVMPKKYLDLGRLVDRHLDVFEKVQTPVLVHFDLWEGNLLAQGENITAILDTERAFYGDPVADFVALNFDIFDPENQPYLATYNRYAKDPIHLDETVLLRYNLFKTYLFMIMYVESDYRDKDGSFADQRRWAASVLDGLYDDFMQR